MYVGQLGGGLSGVDDGLLIEVRPLLSDLEVLFHFSDVVVDVMKEDAALEVDNCSEEVLWLKVDLDQVMGRHGEGGSVACLDDVIPMKNG